MQLHPASRPHTLQSLRGQSTVEGEQQVGGQEEQEVAHVVEADAVVEPRAVVVQPRHAPAKQGRQGVISTSKPDTGNVDQLKQDSQARQQTYDMAQASPCHWVWTCSSVEAHTSPTVGSAC